MTRPESSARYRGLGHPGFLGCVLVLGVNDHVLQAPPPQPTDDDGV